MGRRLHRASRERMGDHVKYESEDWARLAVDYLDDPKLYVVADAMESEHGRKHRYLVKLYWPCVISQAKSAKSFGWMRTTAKKLAESVDDLTPWKVRHRLLSLMHAHGLVVIRQGADFGERDMVDMRPSEHAGWQSMSTAERKRLERARRDHAEGKPVSWTMAHLIDGAEPMSHDVTSMSRAVTTLDETRLDETRLEKVKGSSSQPKAATSRVGSMTNDEVDAEIASCREALGEQASAIVASLVDVMASENTTGTVAASRALRILWRPIAALVPTHSPAALLHGLQAAAAKGAPNHNYVAKAASGHQSAPKLLTRHQPRLSATTDDEYDAIFGGQAAATSDGSAA